MGPAGSLCYPTCCASTTNHDAIAKKIIASAVPEFYTVKVPGMQQVSCLPVSTLPSCLPLHLVSIKDS